jgi:S1-C subfamily serine protease
LIDDKGTIATNHHVIDEAKEASVKFMRGALYEEVYVLAQDPQADLALLQIDLSAPSDGDVEDTEPLTLGDSDKIVVGERAISIGNPLGLEHTLTTGIVSARRTYQGKQWIQMSTPISPGNSGGPVFNEKGDVMGVSTATIGRGFGQNLNLAVPVDVLKAMIKPSYPAKRKVGKAGNATHW